MVAEQKRPGEEKRGSGEAYHTEEEAGDAEEEAGENSIYHSQRDGFECDEIASQRLTIDANMLRQLVGWLGRARAD